jgi:EmrB/QacA subfamily drug resistance transporter
MPTNEISRQSSRQIPGTVPNVNAPGLRTGTAQGRIVLLATILASGMASLDGTVVNIALPKIASDFSLGLTGQQWIVTGYLLTLGSFIVLGGSLGDRFGRREVFLVGIVGFAITSAICGLAPSGGVLIATRLVQGLAAALLVPGSLAIISSAFVPQDRARAIGTWSGLGGVATAGGPFLGGWLVDAASWRWVFLINAPIAAFTVFLTLRWVPETRDDSAPRRVDWWGATTLSLGLAAVVYVLIEGGRYGWPLWTYALAIAGAALLIAFALIELREPVPMVPMRIFRNRRFSGTNAVTFVVYAALGASTFFVVVFLQERAHYSALAAGASLMPITVFMLFGSARSGALAARIGPRLQMTVGPLVVALGLFMLSRVGGNHPSYWTDVLPGVAVLGLGLMTMVAPLTATVLAAIPDREAGIGSAINNAVARIGSLLAVATLPTAVGAAGGGIVAVYAPAMRVAAFLAVAGSVVALLTIRNDPLVAAPIDAREDEFETTPIASRCAFEPPTRL